MSRNLTLIEIDIIFVKKLDIMNIKEFLQSHPLINAFSIEKVLNIPTGTIRVYNNRPIPDKYIDEIINLLKDYGYGNIVTIKASNVLQNDIKKETKYFIKDKCIVLYKDNGLNKRANLSDNTPIYIEIPPYTR